ncbi:MAG: pseudouridine synthase [Pseudomonadales bacterium]|nr:pseudouridine synthase [Pseudomonadales bacterium]
MTNLLLFNKPYGVISQFSKINSTPTLADFIKLKGFYPAGRLDQDSEGLLLLTNDGQLQARIAEPKFKLEKTYWVQVEGKLTEKAISILRQGVNLKDRMTRPAKVHQIYDPALPFRSPPVRHRASIPTSWLEIIITEGKNRQVRRMTANVGFPTLRLYRKQIGSWSVDKIKTGQFESIQVNLPTNNHKQSKRTRS